MLFVSLSKTQKKLVDNFRERRLQMNLTQEGLAGRSGVPLPTLRKFEQKGLISLDSFLKLLSVVGGLEEMIDVLKPREQSFKSIDDVLKSEDKSIKKEEAENENSRQRNKYRIELVLKLTSRMFDNS